MLGPRLHCAAAEQPPLTRYFSVQNSDLQAEIATQLAVLVAQQGHVPLVHLLDEFGADWEETDPLRGGSPLMHAANNGHTAAVTALLEVRSPRHGTNVHSSGCSTASCRQTLLTLRTGAAEQRVGPAHCAVCL